MCTRALAGQRFTVVDTSIGVLVLDNERLKMYKWDKSNSKWEFMSNLPTD